MAMCNVILHYFQFFMYRNASGACLQYVCTVRKSQERKCCQYSETKTKSTLQTHTKKMPSESGKTDSLFVGVDSLWHTCQYLTIPKHLIICNYKLITWWWRCGVERIFVFLQTLPLHVCVLNMAWLWKLTSIIFSLQSVVTRQFHLILFESAFQIWDVNLNESRLLMTYHFHSLHPNQSFP